MLLLSEKMGPLIQGSGYLNKHWLVYQLDLTAEPMVPLAKEEIQKEYFQLS